MEALACLSIACSVMQCINFAHEISSTIKKMKNNGSLDPELRDHAASLASASTELGGYLTGATDQVSGEQANLKDIASKCLNCSIVITSKLKDIDASRKPRLVKAMALMFKKGEFEKLDQEMQKYQMAFQTKILVHLCTKGDAAALTQTDIFEGLSVTLQNFISAYAAGQTRLEDLITLESRDTKTLISSSHMATRTKIEDGTHIIQSLVQAQDASRAKAEHESRREEISALFKDKEMNARKHQIEDSFPETFAWIHEPSTHFYNRGWDSFSQWLESDQQVYWISGKPGSGKSTLMKYLTEDETSRDNVHRSIPDCSVYSHYIWNSGTPQQRSTRGLLRSVLYQSLEDNPAAMDRLLERLGTDLQDLSLKSLERLLVSVLSSREQNVCIFIDGLDEIDAGEDQFELVDLLERIANRTKVKLCVSSRPEPVFKARLKMYPKLRLQDLTYEDMKIFTQDFIQKRCEFQLSDTEKEYLVREVVYKADGVFLWVSLALKSLRRGGAYEDDLDGLLRRLEMLPSELGSLYEKMLERQGDDAALYSQEAARIFNLHLYVLEDPWYHIRLFHYAVVLDSSLQKSLLNLDQKLPLPTLKKFLLKASHLITSRTAGLLEVRPQNPHEGQSVEEALSMYDTYEDQDTAWKSISVEFIHRSAKEFLLDTKSNILEQDPICPKDRKFLFLQALALGNIYAPTQHEEDYGYCSTMISISDGKPALSESEEMSVLSLLQDCYKDGGRSKFYENLAGYGFSRAYNQLSDVDTTSFPRLQTYFLLCALVHNCSRTIQSIDSALAAGADPNVVTIDRLMIRKSNAETGNGSVWVNLPMPAFLQFLIGVWSYRIPEQEFPRIMRLFPNIGAIFDQPFLYRGTRRGVLLGGAVLPSLRPNFSCLTLFSGETYAHLDVLMEINGIGMIQNGFIGAFHSLDAEETTAVCEEHGIKLTNAYSKPLLYLVDDRVYEVNEAKYEDLDAFQEAFMKPLTDHFPAFANEEEIRIVKARKKWKGKEVAEKDIPQWLSDRGYNLPTEADVEKGLSDETSLEEMGRLYEDLTARFGGDKWRK